MAVREPGGVLHLESDVKAQTPFTLSAADGEYRVLIDTCQLEALH